MNDGEPEGQPDPAKVEQEVEQYEQAALETWMMASVYMLAAIVIIRH